MLTITHSHIACDSDSKQRQLLRVCAQIALARARALPTADTSRDRNGSRVLFRVGAGESKNRKNAPCGASVHSHVVASRENGGL